MTNDPTQKGQRSGDQAMRAAEKICKGLVEMYHFPHWSKAFADIIRAHESAEIERLRQALEFYANEKTWREDCQQKQCPEDQLLPTWAEQDFGHKARTALASGELEGKEEDVSNN